MRFSTVPKRQFRPPRLGPAGSTAADAVQGPGPPHARSSGGVRLGLVGSGEAGRICLAERCIQRPGWWPPQRLRQPSE